MYIASGVEHLNFFEQAQNAQAGVALKELK